ncbi:MAG: SPFH domain-containing protein [Desulfamplus sp.]|nr:SPFH domain-containing protein [Desulfamplus sp.]
MALWEKAKAEFIDIIEWTDDSANTMVYRFPRYENEIKYSAKLIVRQSQAAVFVNKGQIADVFPSGYYTLDTDNLPILSTLAGWKYGFHSPFKAEVYFVNLKNFTNLKWGTKNPVILRDPEFGPVRLRAFGTYVVKISEPARFIREIVGTDGHFTLEKVTDQLRNLIITRFCDLLGDKNIPVLDLTASYDELSRVLTKIIAPEFLEYGLDVTKLLVENISFPTEVEEALDKRSSMGIIGNLDNYFKFQSANAMELAAKNPGGDASAGVGMGMGFAMANQMAEAMRSQQRDNQYDSSAQQNPTSASNRNNSNIQSTPPPLPTTPPPLPATEEPTVEYYVAMQGRKLGPIEINIILRNIKKEKILPDTLIWRQGLDGWQRADTIEELKSALKSVPPPLPDNLQS